MPQLSLVYDRDILKDISFSTASIVVAHDELVRSFSIIFAAAHHFILTSLTRRCSQPLAALRFRRSKALPPTNINPYLGHPIGVAELDVRLKYPRNNTKRNSANSLIRQPSRGTRFSYLLDHMKITNLDDHRVPIFVGTLFMIVGIIQISSYWDGLVAWIEVCSRNYSEVRGTPFEPIWTSLRAVGGIGWIVGAGFWFLQLRRPKLKQTPTGQPE